MVEIVRQFFLEKRKKKQVTIRTSYIHEKKRSRQSLQRQQNSFVQEQVAHTHDVAGLLGNKPLKVLQEFILLRFLTLCYLKNTSKALKHETNRYQLAVRTI